MRKSIRWKGVIVLFSIFSAVSGCSVQGDSEGLISISPKSAVVKFGATEQFSVSPTDAFVTWSVNGIDNGNAATVGSIDSDGLYTAPLLDPSDTTERVTIRATDTASSSGSAKVFLTHFKTNIKLTQYAANAFRANTYSGGQRSIAVYKDGNNNVNVYAVWSDNSQGLSRIWLSKSSDGGANFDTPLAVDEGISPNQISPAAAVDGSGNVFIVWEDHREGDADIFLKKYDGSGFSTRQRVNSDTTGSLDYDTNPSLAIDSLNTVYVVWEHRSDSTDNYPDIYFARSTDLGQTFSTPAYVAFTNGRRPAIAIDSLNTAYVVWEDLTGFPDQSPTHIKICAISGGVPGPSVQIESSLFPDNYHARSPSVAAGPGGKIFVVWQRALITNPRFSGEIITTYDLDLAWVISSLQYDIISSFPHDPNVGFFGGPVYPAIAADNSQIYIAWGDQRNGTKDIYFTKSSDGATFTTNRIVNDETGTWHEKPSVAVAEGKAYVTWTDYRNTSTVTTISPNDVFFSREE